MDKEGYCSIKTGTVDLKRGSLLDQECTCGSRGQILWIRGGTVG